MFNLKTRLTDFPSLLPVHNTVSCCRKTSQRDGERRGEKGGKKLFNPFSFAPSSTETMYHDTCTWYKTLIPSHISIHTQPGGGATRGRWWAHLLCLERDFPVMVGRSGIIVC